MGLSPGRCSSIASMPAGKRSSRQNSKTKKCSGGLAPSVPRMLVHQACQACCQPAPQRDFFGIIERGGTAQGATAKMRSWTRVRHNGAFRLRAQGFCVEARHSDKYPVWFGYISDMYQRASALCLEAVPEGAMIGEYSMSIAEG